MLIKPKVKLLSHQFELVKSQEKFIAIVGGYRSGKTEAAVHRALYLLQKRQNGVVVIISPTFRLLMDSVFINLTKNLDKFKMQYRYIVSSHTFYIKDKYFEGQIWLRSGDDPNRIVGFEATDFILDEFDTLREEHQKKVWQKVISRISGCKDGTGAITTTPEGFKYTYELIQTGLVKHIKAKTYENPFISKEYVDNLYNFYSPEQVQAYINGEFVNLIEGVICKNFDRNKHIKDLSNLKNNSQLHIGMDFNVQKMCANVNVIESKANNQYTIYQIDEIVLRDAGIDEMIAAIKNRYSNREIYIYPDASSRNRQVINVDTCPLQKLQEAFGFLNIRGEYSTNGFFVNLPVRESVGVFLGFIKNANNEINFFVDPKCIESIKDYEQCCWTNRNEIDKKSVERSGNFDAQRYVCQYFREKKARW